jgi:hypothetical protein
MRRAAIVTGVLWTLFSMEATAAAAISSTLAPAEVALGTASSVTGNAGQPGASVALQADPYPFHGYATVARTTSAADGSFAFASVRSDRNERLRAVVDGQDPGPTLTLIVNPRVSLEANSLGVGRTRIALRLRHARIGARTAVAVSWFVSPRGSRVFRLAAVTSSVELRPGLLAASAVVDPPSRRFVYRVCLNPPWEAAMGAAAVHGRCPTRDFVLPASHAG